MPHRPLFALRVVAFGLLSALLILPASVNGVVRFDQRAVPPPGKTLARLFFTVKPNRPNPFNPATRIAYDVPQAAHIILAVYNLLGQQVARLVDEPKAPGRYVVAWDGRNVHGEAVASGVYLYRLTMTAGFSQTRWMTLLK
ncbi:MAG: T9SS type A sorting domain-containing protein [Candidatus Latescibacteria bacterium]|nr:T9SS type A sorting domain-containing protein [Candidatus Latescibacterota bacterium]